MKAYSCVAKASVLAKVHINKQRKPARFVLPILLSLVPLAFGHDKIAAALSLLDLQGPWQAGLIWSGSGCGPQSGFLKANLNNAGVDGAATLVTHGACGDSTSMQTFTIQSLNPDNSGTANLSCGPGCGWTFQIQVHLDGLTMNMVDVTDPGNFGEGTAIRQPQSTGCPPFCGPSSQSPVPRQ